MFFITFAIIFYVISGLRRLIQFNIDADAGEIGKFFVGIPTPLGAILLWLVYLSFTFNTIPTFFQISPEYIVISLMIVIGYMLNSKVKIRHL